MLSKFNFQYKNLIDQDMRNPELPDFLGFEQEMTK